MRTIRTCLVGDQTNEHNPSDTQTRRSNIIEPSIPNLQVIERPASLANHICHFPAPEARGGPQTATSHLGTFHNHLTAGAAQGASNHQVKVSKKPPVTPRRHSSLGTSLVVEISPSNKSKLARRLSQRPRPLTSSRSYPTTLDTFQMSSPASEEFNREDLDLQLAMALSLNEASAIEHSEPDESSVIVKNLGNSLTDEQLVSMFQAFGTIFYAQIQRHTNGESKGK